MAKSIADKLLIKPGASLWVSDASRAALVGPLPEGVTMAPDLASAAVAIVIVDDVATVTKALATHADALASPAVLWFVYPKGGRADINRDTLWPMVAVHGLRPITQVAIDETWSALRFRPLRPDEPPFVPGG